MEPMAEDWDRAVAVVAHPDDLEYGAASAVARWTGQGKQVSYLLATRGEAGIAGMAPDRVGPLRVDEERRSAAVVGVTEVVFLEHADGLVEYGIPLRRDLAAAFRRLRPEVVITMSFDLTWGDEGPVNHADHRAVGLATLDACRDAANEWVFPKAGPGVDRHQGRVRGYDRPRRHTSSMSPPASTRALRRCASTGPTSRAWAGNSTPTSSCGTWRATPAWAPGASTPSRFTGTRWADPPGLAQRAGREG